MCYNLIEERTERKKRGKQRLRKRNSRHGRRLRSIPRVPSDTRREFFPLSSSLRPTSRWSCNEEPRNRWEVTLRETQNRITPHSSHPDVEWKVSRNVSPSEEMLNYRIRYADTIAKLRFNRWDTNRDATWYSTIPCSTKYGRPRRVRFVRIGARAC